MIRQLNGYIFQELIRYIFETDPADVYEVHVTPGSVTITEFIRNDQGNYVMDLHTQEVATRTTIIPFVFQ